MPLSGLETGMSDIAGMFDRAWKLFYWSSAALIAALAGADAYVWIGSEAGARLASAGVCGFVVTSIWLLVGASLYDLASR